MPICFVYHFYYKTKKKKLIDSRSTNHAEKRRFDPSHNSAVCFTGRVRFKSGRSTGRVHSYTSARLVGDPIALMAATLVAVVGACIVHISAPFDDRAAGWHQNDRFPKKRFQKRPCTSSGEAFLARQARSWLTVGLLGKRAVLKFQRIVPVQGTRLVELSPPRYQY